MTSLKQLVLSTFLLGAIASVFAQGAVALTEGEVRKVEFENRKITLKHGEIKNLDRPPMTMVFQVSNTAMPEKVKADGKLTVTEIKALQ
jgi:Cu(I)/Ag(I) efflux system protein CusF